MMTQANEVVNLTSSDDEGYDLFGLSNNNNEMTALVEWKEPSTPPSDDQPNLLPTSPAHHTLVCDMCEKMFAGKNARALLKRHQNNVCRCLQCYLL